MSSSQLMPALQKDNPLIKSVINAVDECGQTLFIRNIFSEDHILREKTLEALLVVGVNIWAVDAYRRNALMWACLFRRDYEVSRLVQLASPMEMLQTDLYGNTALHLAVTSGSAAIVKLITNCMVEHKLSLDVENSAGVTPRMEALRLGHDICYSLLTGDLPEEKEHIPYHHVRRAAASNITLLPPILPPNLESKMKSYDMKACYQLADENPSNYLKKACWKKTKSVVQQAKGLKESRLPPLACKEEPRENFSS